MGPLCKQFFELSQSQVTRSVSGTLSQVERGQNYHCYHTASRFQVQKPEQTPRVWGRRHKDLSKFHHPEVMKKTLLCLCNRLPDEYRVTAVNQALVWTEADRTWDGELLLWWEEKPTDHRMLWWLFKSILTNPCAAGALPDKAASASVPSVHSTKGVHHQVTWPAWYLLLELGRIFE